MRRFYIIILIFSVFMSAVVAQEHRRYALVWHDEFESGVLDQKVWSKIWRSRADWAIHMSSADTLYAFEDGDLVLRGMVNDFLPKDTALFLTGGVWSRHKKSFGFGRLEIRAKFDVAQGFWPAIWMLPQTNQALNWPYGGEIDIMEHFRDNQYVNQTVHSDYTVNLRRRNLPSQVAYPSYNEGQYNTYGMERFQDSLVFFVNGRRTHNYPRFRNGVDGQFPFSQHDFYLILDAQLGRDRSPYIDTAKLPVELRVDYVRYYEIDTRTDVIPEPEAYQQVAIKLKKLRKVVYDRRTRFDNPDEYTLVVKCGKAKIAGNRQWAESTLAQLVDENGYVANLKIHDLPACPLRGVSLEKCAAKLKYDDLSRLLDRMAFYKLNYLKWNGEGACTPEEVDRLKEQAHNLGITLMSGNSVIPNIDIIELTANPSTPVLDQVFLYTASKKGGWLLLNDLGKEGMDAMMAFSERYWRGGNAGEVGQQLNAMTPVGSRLANFKEKTAIHYQRFP